MIKKSFLVPIIAVLLFVTTVSFKRDFFEIAKQIEIFTTVFKELNMNYVDETNPAELMDKAIKGMLANLDPYTVFWNEQQVEDARINNSGIYTGIGATVRTKKDKLIILEPFKDYPADKAGLKAGDEIIKIDNLVISEVEQNAGDLLKGTAGSTINVTYLRQGKENTTTITRGAIDVHAVPFYKLINDDIGYIVLTKFNKKTTIETKNALESLKAEGAKKLILDLRGNPGGLLNEAINIVNLFVPKGEVIVTTKSAVEKYNKVFKTNKEPIDTEIPLVVLVNGRSASASEIVSGALQDLDRAVVVGARSFGKGLVQRPKKVAYGTQMKITISRYYTPSGRCIQALDYWNRDENGDPVRVDPKNYNKFKTKGGRTVYDGGGIMPDIELKSANFSPITTALLKDYAIFDFATNYYYSHQLTDLNQFNFTQTDFQNFKQFLKEKNFKYNTETEKLLEEAYKKAETDGLTSDIESSYTQLMQTIDRAKETVLDTKIPEIKSLIEDEILKRYFYREGMYTYHLSHSEVVLKAIEILNDTKKYHKILK
jgi:carboxyl-terminal processing protease